MFEGRLVNRSHDRFSVVRINSIRSTRHLATSDRSSNTSARLEQNTRWRSPALRAASFHAIGLRQFASDVRTRGAFGPQRSSATSGSLRWFFGRPPTRLSYASA